MSIMQRIWMMGVAAVMLAGAGAATVALRSKADTSEQFAEKLLALGGGTTTKCESETLSANPRAICGNVASFNDLRAWSYREEFGQVSRWGVGDVNDGATVYVAEFLKNKQLFKVVALTTANDWHDASSYVVIAPIDP